MDDREPSHFKAIGTLTIELPEGRGAGTATLIDECGILTNFHVVFGPWFVTALRPPSHAFVGTFTLTEVTLPDGMHPSARAIPVIWGAYEGPDRMLRAPQNDWVYLILDRCLGSDYGYMRIRAATADEVDADTVGFAAVGYSRGIQMIDPACSVHAARPINSGDVWLDDCALLPGDSGGPVLRAHGKSVAAIGSSFLSGEDGQGCGLPQTGDTSLETWDVNCSNVAVPLTQEIIDRVEAAYVAVGVQRALKRLGYDAGELGAIDDARARAAIEQAQSQMGWSVTGEPSYALLKILMLQVATN